MVLLNTLCFVLHLVLSPAVPTKPTFKYVEGVWYSAVNPLSVAVELTLNCGADFEPVKIKLAPRTKEEVMISEPGTVMPAVCTLNSWRGVR